MSSILFINRVYPPESGATGRVLEYAARGLVNAGWDVSVLTTSGGRTNSGQSVVDGVKVIRIDSPFSKENMILRAVGYGLMIPSLLMRALFLPRADVVVTMTDPPMSAVMGPVLKLLRGSKLIHWAQDLYPEVAEEVGVFKKRGITAGMLRFLSSSSLRFHDLNLAVGRCMAGRLEKRGIPSSRITVMPNVGMERDIIPMPRGKSTFRELHGIGEEFVIMYSGNMGRAHEFETIVECARILQERGESRILFLFAGDGPAQITIRNSVTKLGLRNVMFVPAQNAGHLSESLGMADLHLVTMKEGMSGLVVPSKFYGVMAAGRPTLFVGSPDSEVGRVIGEKRIGEVIEVGDAEKIAVTILNYRDYPSRIEQEGNLARNSILREDLLPILIQEADRISLSSKVL